MKSLLIALLAVVQLGVPLAMIAKYEAVLAYGQGFKFHCAPVDPIDHLRGRYVALNFNIGLPPSDNYSKSERKWAVIEADAEGFAKAGKISDSKPCNETAIKYSIRWGRPELPFNKYFMNENLAPKAELAYRDATLARRFGEMPMKNASNCYLKVKIWHGMAVPEQLYIDGKPVEELLREKGK